VAVILAPSSATAICANLDPLLPISLLSESPFSEAFAEHSSQLKSPLGENEGGVGEKSAHHSLNFLVS
jgi:hypothetical protein